jgi:fatty acid desaturase
MAVFESISPVSEGVQQAGFDGDDLDIVARRVVGDLHAPKAAIFWIDMLASAAIGWVTFAAAVRATTWPLILAAGVTSALALYRGLCFTHELTHLRRGSIPGFETTWNILLGVPLLLPSFTYVGVHQSHHNLSTYGTKDDPEYLPFASSRKLIVGFSIQSSFLIPILLLARFVVLAPVGLVWPRFHRWLEVYASSFAMNPEYRRQMAPPMVARMRRWESLVVAVWTGLFALMISGVVPWRALATWYGVLALVSLINTLRVLGAHAYEAHGVPRDRRGQLLDSLDTPGGPWTALWAPVGLRYHA